MQKRAGLKLNISRYVYSENEIPDIKVFLNLVRGGIHWAEHVEKRIQPLKKRMYCMAWATTLLKGFLKEENTNLVKVIVLKTVVQTT